MKPMTKRVVRLETGHGDMSLVHLSDRALADAFEGVKEELDNLGWNPVCGWEAPLPQLINELEKELCAEG